MREILFRGKLTDDSKWVYGCLLDRIYGAVPAIMSEQSVDDAFNLEFEYDHVEEKTVGQYTGMKDKNGRRIFEGDICRFREWSKGEMCWVGKVHWEHQQFLITGGPNKECETMFELCMSRFIPENIEVIGNIHDNPELLEKP